MKDYDLVVIGAGVVGLAHAYHAVQAGLSVAVLERSTRAAGASVRNFGMLAIVAQQPGPELDSARRSLVHWQAIASQAGIAMRQAGCLFVARAPEEMSVLSECAASNAHAFTLMSQKDLAGVDAPLRQGQLLGGLWSPDAWKLDQREAMAKMADWLERAHGVAFHFNTAVTGISSGQVETEHGLLDATHVVLCGGDAFETLYADAFRDAGVTRCQLQMLRTASQPPDCRVSPFVLGGLSITRYSVFKHCPSLPDLVAWQKLHQARYLEQGIHVIACQEDDGSITIGDSHSYGNDLPPERSAKIDQLILDELAEMIALPEPAIAERWLGHYAHLPGTSELILSPEPGVTAVTITNGQGMTHALTLAERVVGKILGQG